MQTGTEIMNYGWQQSRDSNKVNARANKVEIQISLCL